MARVKKQDVPLSASDAAIRELRRYGLSYPKADTKSPWPGHEDLAVKDKTFAYLPPEGQPFSIGCKLPATSDIALMLPYAKPTPYGLGKSGWVTATPADDEIDIDMFKQWIDESYRAQAPKKLVAEIGLGLDDRTDASIPGVQTKQTASKSATASKSKSKSKSKSTTAKKPTAKKPKAKSTRKRSA